MSAVGIDPAAGTSADDAYGVLFLPALLSYQVAPIVLILYVCAIGMAYNADPPELAPDRVRGRATRVK